MKKKILIPYATYGSGHKAIAAYIEKYFKSKNEDVEIRTLDILQYSMPLMGKLSRTINHFLMLKQPVIWDICYRLSDTQVTAKLTEKVGTKLFKNKRLQKAIEDFNPDLTISTHFFGSSLIAYYNKKGIINSKLITIVTDYVAHELWLTTHRSADYLVVCSKEEKRLLIKNKKIDKNKIKTYGIPIFPSTDVINKDNALKKLKLDNGNLTCVFFAGGSNSSTAILPYVKRLLRKKLPINIIFISGTNKKVENKINEYVKQYNNNNNCKVFGYVNNVPELLQIADFVVTKPGGAQTTECLYFKKPMIMLRSSGGQESGNIKYILNKGYGKMFWFPFTFANFVSKIANNSVVLDNMKSNLSKMNNQDAMEKIYNLAIKVLNK